MTDTSRKPATPGVIDPTNLYRVDELRARLGWKAHAWRTAIRNGLRVLRAGGRAYVLGSDLIEHLSRMNATEGQRDE